MRRNKIKIRKVFATVTVTMFTAVTLLAVGVTPANADVIGQEECFPAVLMLRGSGEDSIDDGVIGVKNYEDSDEKTVIRTNGHEGEKLSTHQQCYQNTLKS